LGSFAARVDGGAPRMPVDETASATHTHTRLSGMSMCSVPFLSAFVPKGSACGRTTPARRRLDANRPFAGLVDSDVPDGELFPGGGHLGAFLRLEEVEPPRSIRPDQEKRMPSRATRVLAVALAAALATITSAAAQRRRPAGPPKRDKAGAKPPGTKTGKKAPERRAADIARLMKLYEGHKYISPAGQLPYRLLRPIVYDRGRKYPMVVCLHGVPGRGKDNVMQLGATYPVDVLSRPEMRRKHPCFVLAPQSRTWWGDRPYGAKPGAARGKDFPAMSLLLECVGDLSVSLGVDPNRVYLTGHSMGGFGVFNALSSDPNMWAAAAVVSGGGDPNHVFHFSHVPLWVFVGGKSPILHYSRDVVDALQRVGGAPSYTVLQDAGHNCWRQVYDAPAVWDWLFAKRRVIRLFGLTTQPATGPATQPATRPAVPRE